MFGQHEDAIRELVDKAHTPVLGLLGGLMPSDVKEAVRRDVCATPGSRPYIQRLDQYPALFGVWLAEHVMHGMGAAGHFDVYPHVRAALGGAPDLSSSDRESLWYAFRRAMFKLGIQPLPRTSGSHYMTDEYVRQAGVPLAYADDLAARMLTHAKTIGVPDEDDQEGLLAWQSALLNRLQVPFSTTARKAVARDANAYYTRAFLRVLSNHGHPTNGDALETAFSLAFNSSTGTGSIKRAAIPQLVYRDGVLGIWFPPSNLAQVFDLACGQRTTSLRLEECGGFRQLPAALPSDAQLRTQGGELLISVKLWADKASNRLLIFNDAGRLRASAQLGQSEPVELAPGRYVALCRFTPTNSEDWIEVSEEPQLIELVLDVRPGAQCTLINGPACVLIEGQNQPSFTLSGISKVSLERVEFYFGQLKATVEIPRDWLLAGQNGFEVRVSSGLNRVTAPMQLDADGRGTVHLPDVVSRLGLKDGMHRLVFELGRAAQARALQRQSLLYWAGLSAVSHGLKFSLIGRPTNLVESVCTGVKVSDTQIEPSSNVGRVIQLGFDVGQGRVVHLSWNRPGLFIDVEVPGADGTLVRVSKPVGSTETVSLTQEKNIVISASEPGILKLGEWSQFIDFAHRPSKSLPASFLASRIVPGARTLTYQSGAGSVELPLLQLSQPHVAIAVDTSKLANVYEVRLKMHGEPTAIVVNGVDVNSGSHARAEQDVISGEWRTSEFARMQVYCAATPNSSILHILMDVTTVPNGIWLLSFEAKIGNVWGQIEDTEEGRIAIALATDPQGQETSSTLLIADVPGLDLPEVVMRLGNLNNHFKQFWSNLCRVQQSWLNSYWRALIDRLKGEESTYLMQLLDMVMSQTQEQVRPGWLPKQSVAGQLPLIFAQRRAEYKRTNIKPHPLSISLRAMPEFRGAITPAFGLTIHPCVAFSFRNILEISKGSRPRGFDLSKYREVLETTPVEAAYRLDEESFLPQPGELLGPLHLAHAWLDLERGYAVGQLMPSPRKALALSMSRALHQKWARFDAPVPATLHGQSLVLRLKPLPQDGVEDAEQQRQENLTQIANACAWLAWAYRLNVRKPGAFAEFYERMETIRRQIPIEGNGVTDCCAYYMHVAPAMFSYYLLLWELVLATEMDPAVQNV